MSVKTSRDTMRSNPVVGLKGLPGPTSRVRFGLFAALLTATLLGNGIGRTAIAQDVIPPEEVANLRLHDDNDDVVLEWNPVTTDITGAPESAVSYRVYRGAVSSFTPDKVNGVNMVYSAGGNSAPDAGSFAVSDNYFYLVSAVDSDGNEGNTRPSKLAELPEVTGGMSTTAANLQWSPAGAPADVGGYRILWGPDSRIYDSQEDVGNTTEGHVFPLDASGHYFTVLAYDTERNVLDFSNELYGWLFSGGGPTSVSACNIAQNTTWSVAGSPYVISCSDLSVAGPVGGPDPVLTIEPGVEVLFDVPGASISIGTESAGRGALWAAGTPTQPIVFRPSATNPTGRWRAIQFRPSAVTNGSVLDYCAVDLAGTDQTDGAVSIEGGDPTISHSRILRSDEMGIHVWSGSPAIEYNIFAGNDGWDVQFEASSNSVVRGNTFHHSVSFFAAEGDHRVIDNDFRDYDQYNLRVGAHAVGELDTNSFSGIGATSRIDVLGETIEESVTWPDLGFAYRLDSTTLAVGGSSIPPPVLTIAPGVTLEFSGGSIEVGNPNVGSGGLVARGTVAEPVVFTGATKTPGSWQGIRFLGAAFNPGSALENCVVEYGGAGSVEANVWIDHRSPSIERCVLRNSQKYAISADNSGSRIHHCDFAGNPSGAIKTLGPVSQVLDARFNYFGDPSGPSGPLPFGTGESVGNGVAIGPWLATPHTTANYAADWFQSTFEFQPGASYVRFTGELAQDSDWTLEILDPSGQHVDTLEGSGTDVLVDWDGRVDGGSPAAEAQFYTYRFEADSTTTGEPIAPLVSFINLNDSVSIGEITSPPHLQTFAIGTQVAIMGTAEGPSYELKIGEGLFPKSYTTIASVNGQVTDGLLATWDTSGYTNGLYLIELLVANPADPSPTLALVGSVVLAVDSVTADPSSFSPNGDDIIDTVTAVATLSAPSDWTMDITDVGTANVVRTYSGTGVYVAETWDGTLPDNMTIAPEGPYRFDLTAIREGEEVANSSPEVLLDLTPPVVTIASPAEGQLVFGNVDIEGDASDPNDNLENYVLDFGQGSQPTLYETFAGGTAPVLSGLLGTWSTVVFDPPSPSALADDEYEIRLTANDQAGNTSTTSRHVNLDNLTFSSVSAAPTTIDTFQGGSTDVSFTIDHPATVTMKIRPETDATGGPVLRTVSSSFAAGSHSLVWDGRDDGGLPVPDDAYVYILEADDGAGRLGRYPMVEVVDQDLDLGGGSSTPIFTEEIPLEYNPYTNEFWRITYAPEPSTPGHVTMEVRPDGPQSNFNAVTMKPHDGQPFDIVWDGRDLAGNILDEGSFINFPLTRLLRPNSVLTTGDSPTVSDPNSGPYVVVMAYGQVSRIRFTLERDANVTITILPPGVSDPGDPSGLEVVTDTFYVAGTHEILFDPVDPTDPDEVSMFFAEEGPYTFALETVNPDTGTAVVTRGVLNMFP